MIKPRGENNVPSGKVAGEQFQGHRWASTRRSNGAPSGCGNSLMPLAIAIKEVIGNNTIPTILLERSRALLLYLVAVRWNATTIDIVGTHTTYYLPPY